MLMRQRTRERGPPGGGKICMRMTTEATEAQDAAPEREEKHAALGYLHGAWTQARHDGIDGDCMAQACLFTALAELVTTYGEEATARFIGLMCISGLE